MNSTKKPLIAPLQQPLKLNYKWLLALQISLLPLLAASNHTLIDYIYWTCGLEFFYICLVGSIWLVTKFDAYAAGLKSKLVLIIGIIGAIPLAIIVGGVLTPSLLKASVKHTGISTVAVIKDYSLSQVNIDRFATPVTADIPTDTSTLRITIEYDGHRSRLAFSGDQNNNIQAMVYEAIQGSDRLDIRYSRVLPGIVYLTEQLH